MVDKKDDGHIFDNELKPCPMCGGPGQMISDYVEDRDSFVLHDLYTRAEKLVRKWNTRVEDAG